MSVVRAFWSRLLRPLKILFWVIIGIVVIGVIWVGGGVLIAMLS